MIFHETSIYSMGSKCQFSRGCTFVVPLNDVCKNLALGIWLNC